MNRGEITFKDLCINSIIYQPQQEQNQVVPAAAYVVPAPAYVAPAVYVVPAPAYVVLAPAYVVPAAA